MKQTKKISNQADLVIQHLRKYKFLTQDTAQERYAISRLGARIYELKAAGWRINKTMVSDKNKFGKKHVYAKYFLEK